MNLRQLRYFVRVVDAGNMTRAADLLHVAPTALGMQIRQIEEDVGTALLVRHSRGVEPTEAGSLLHARALAILKLVEETRRDVMACARQQKEMVRLGVTPALMLTLGPEIAVQVRENQPQITLGLVEAMSHVLAEALARGEVDFILCYDVPDDARFARIALLQDDLVLVTLPGPGKGEPITLADALDKSLAMPEAGDTVRNAVVRVAKELGLELKVSYEVRSISAMKSLVSRGAASSILPYASVLEEVRSGTLDARPIVMPPIRRTLFLASSTQRAPFRSEVGLSSAIKFALQRHTENLGPLAHPILG